MNLDFRSSNTVSVAQKLKLPDHPGQSSLFGLSSADHSMEDYDVAGVVCRNSVAFPSHHLLQTDIQKPGVNRSHTRAILAPVTQPLVKFISTKQLVEAIRGAIKGVLFRYTQPFPWAYWQLNRTSSTHGMWYTPPRYKSKQCFSNRFWAVQGISSRLGSQCLCARAAQP